MVLTLVEMVALSRVLAILHFKVCMSLRWLAGNTHMIVQQGYNLPTRLMGKAIDAMYDAMVAIEQDGQVFWMRFSWLSLIRYTLILM